MMQDEVQFMPDGYSEPPTPYREEDDPAPFWSQDLYDHVVPKQKGFLTDLIYTMRGMEVPTMFTLWSGLWLLSTVVKREAWLKWFPKPLYLNLYVVLAAPAGSKKSVTIDDVGVPVVEKMQQYIRHPNIRRMKNIAIVKDKMTPEAMLDAMLPGNKPGKASFMLVDDEGNTLLDSAGRPLRYKATSEMGLVLSEMTSSIGKRSYTEGFVEILLDLYNPKHRWEWRTKGEGVRVLQRTYLTMLAATTPTAFKESVPKVAAGDGFLSRCIIVYQAVCNRRFSIPRPVPNAPTEDELAKRLAWIAENSLGEYVLSDEAFAVYDRWYADHKDFVEENEAEGGLRGRMALNVLKIATLIRMQRYAVQPVGIVEEQDMRDAIEMLHVTYGLGAELLGELGDELKKVADRVMRLLNKHKKLKRVDLMRKSHMQVEALNQVIDYLVQTGDIMIIGEGGKRKSYPSRNGQEVYQITELFEQTKREYSEVNGNGRGKGKGTTFDLQQNTNGEDAEGISDLRDGACGRAGAGHSPHDVAKRLEREQCEDQDETGGDENGAQGKSPQGGLQQVAQGERGEDAAEGREQAEGA